MRSILATAVSLLPFFYTSASARPQTSTSSVACNNSPSLCNQPYFNVTYLGAHDSAFVANSSNRYDISANQYFNTTMQLNAGVRLLQAQIQQANGSDGTSQLHLCHTTCSLYDAGTVQGWLEEVNAWMGANPNEVVTILLVNGVNADAATLGEIFTNSGITQYSYTPTSQTAESWPTLGEMISANTRLVTFIAAIQSSSTAAPFLLNEWDYVWENNYQVVSSSNFTCAPARPSAVAGSFSTAQSSGRMFLMNHFLYQEQLFSIQSPDVENAGSTNSPDVNSVGALGYSANDCTNQYGSKPNYILVDWFNVGPAIDTVDRLNQVSDVTGRTTVTTANLKIEGDSSSSSGAGRLEKSVLAVLLGVAAAVSVGWM